MAANNTLSTYSYFKFLDSFHLLRDALRRDPHYEMESFLAIARADEAMMVEVIGKPVERLQMLEIGPGQSKNSAYYFRQNNDVTTLDLNVIPEHLFDLEGITGMLRANGVGRTLKTLARYLVRGRRERKMLAKSMGVPRLESPTNRYGDICTVELPADHYDVIYSFSVFEHIAEPERALRNMIASLRPGGIFHIQIHLYTSNSGHHDTRAFTGLIDELPLWGHLRESQRHLIYPSSYLNEWRLPDWRRLLNEIAPGHRENLYQYEHAERFGGRLTPEIRAELADYTDEELFTLKAEYLWRKPA